MSIDLRAIYKTENNLGSFLKKDQNPIDVSSKLKSKLDPDQETFFTRNKLRNARSFHLRDLDLTKVVNQVHEKEGTNMPSLPETTEELKKRNHEHVIH